MRQVGAGAVLLGCMVAGLVVTGCKDPGVKSEEACEEFISTVECGEFDFSTTYPCASYADSTCNLSDYFDCVAENITCDEAASRPSLEPGACDDLLCEEEPTGETTGA